ncbi:MAG: protein kinase domain-containing protein, partial [Thermoguttaceae bacterium]
SLAAMGEVFPHSDTDFDLCASPPISASPSNESANKTSIAPPTTQSLASDSHATGFPAIWKVGDVILGVYEVKELAPGVSFAEGGVGVVHRVYHREWDIDLAVKSPKVEVFQTESGKQSYEKEAQTWVELGLHPNIVTCYLVRRIDDIPRLFAEFVPNGSLREWIRDGRLYKGGQEESLRRILSIATQFAWGLEHAHKQKLVHFDVKPANVMMSGQTAKVTDFGLAQGLSDTRDSKRWESANSTASPVNTGGGMTPGYCSPEQFLSFTLTQKREFDKLPKITHHSDIWSWGISFLSMFHGRPPCKRGGQTARKVLEFFANTPPPNEDRPKIPQKVIELLFHCFEEIPEKRPESMEYVADQLIKIYAEIEGTPFPHPKPISATSTPESINNRAVSLLDLGKPEDAAKLLEQADNLQAWHPEVTYNRSLLKWRNGRMTDLEIQDKLEALVKTRPQAATAHYALGLTELERGSVQVACDAFEAALELETREEILRNYERAKKSIGKATKCIERIKIPVGFEDKILVDEDAGLLRICTGTASFDLRETTTGQIRNSFKVPNQEEKTKNPKRVGLSSDLLWELVCAAEPDTMKLCRVGCPSASSSFRPLNWIRYFGPNGRAAANENELGLETETKKRPETNAKKREIYTLPNIPWVATFKETRIDIFDKKSRKKICDLFGHEDIVSALAFSQDGRFALTGGIDKTMRLWELPKGRCLHTFRSLSSAVDAVHLGRNGQYALSLLAGGSLQIWDISILCAGKTHFRAPLLLSHISSAEELGQQQLEMNEKCELLRKNMECDDFAAAVASLQIIKNLPGWESARKTLAQEGIFDALSKKVPRVAISDALCTQSLVGHHDTISSVRISRNGKLAASAGRDNTVCVWNLDQQRRQSILEGHSDWIRSIAITSDAKFIISGSWDTTVRIWNISTAQCVRTFGEKIKSLTKIAISPLGGIVAIANGSGSVFVWDVLANKTTARFLAHSGSVNSIRFHSDGQHLVTGGDDQTICIWQIGKESPIQTIRCHKSPVTAAVLTTDKKRLLSGNREGRIMSWNLPANKLESDVQGHFGEVTSLNTIADDNFYITSSKDAKIRICDTENRSAPRLLERSDSPIFSFATDLLGHRIITGGEDAILNVWDIYWNYLEKK